MLETREYTLCLPFRPGGGGGTRNIYWWGCALAHQKRGVLGAGTFQKGVLRCGHSPKKMGVLGAGTTRKRGLRHARLQPEKRGNLELVLLKERVLGTEVAQKGVLGAYLFIIFTFTCQHDQLDGCVLAG